MGGLRGLFENSACDETQKWALKQALKAVYCFRKRNGVSEDMLD